MTKNSFTTMMMAVAALCLLASARASDDVYKVDNTADFAGCSDDFYCPAKKIAAASDKVSSERHRCTELFEKEGLDFSEYLTGSKPVGDLFFAAEQNIITDNSNLTVCLFMATHAQKELYNACDSAFDYAKRNFDELQNQIKSYMRHPTTFHQIFDEHDFLRSIGALKLCFAKQAVLDLVETEVHQCANESGGKLTELQSQISELILDSNFFNIPMRAALKLYRQFNKLSWGYKLKPCASSWRAEFDKTQQRIEKGSLGGDRQQRESWIYYAQGEAKKKEWRDRKAAARTKMQDDDDNALSLTVPFFHNEKKVVGFIVVSVVVVVGVAAYIGVAGRKRRNQNKKESSATATDDASLPAPISLV